LQIAISRLFLRLFLNSLVFRVPWCAGRNVLCASFFLPRNLPHSFVPAITTIITSTLMKLARISSTAAGNPHEPHAHIPHFGALFV
jgi:hypothetical protein